MRIKFHREARSAPDSIDGLKVPYGAAKRQAPKWRWRLILLAVLSPAILLTYSALKSVLTLSANGSVFLDQYEVRAPLAGRVAQLAVRLGAEVRKGDAVLYLDEPRADGPSGSREGRETAPSARSRAWLLEELTLQERTLHMQEDRTAATEGLVRQGAATAAELREAQVALNQTQAAVLRVRQQLATTSTHSGAAERGSQPQIVKRERIAVRASQDGRIIDVMTTDGEFVGPGEPLVLIGTRAKPHVIGYVSPEIAPRLRVGSRATIRFPDGTKARARVAEQPMLTRRMPPDLVDQFGVRPMTVVLRLETDEEWPADQRIHGLPVTVRFHYEWEPW
jgi:multidrug resistance efflux pump